MEKITSFQIIDMTLSGFKSYNEPTTFTFGNPTAITGGNGRGKSSIADAIAFAITGLPFFGENGIDRLHCDDNNDLSISIRFADGGGAVHQLVRKRRKSTMYITFDGYDIRQKDLTSMFGEKDVFLSIFNPLYFIEELGDKGKHLLERHLPVISHDAILAEMSASSQAALKDKDLLSPDGCLKKLRGEIRSLEESIIYLTGQKDLAEQQAETMQTSYADLRNRLTMLAEEETALKNKQFEDLSIPQMQEQLVDLSGRYSDVAKDDTQMRQQLLETEINHLRQQRAQRMEQAYESKFTATHAETTGMVKLLTEQYRKELTQAKALTIGGDCPTCHRPITEETLPQVQEAFKKVLESIVAQGREGRQQLDEISNMEVKAQETFETFKAQDVATMDAKMDALYAQQEQLANEDSGALDTLRTQIQELTSLLEYGNLSQEEYQRLHTCHNELMDCQGQIATLDRMVKDADINFDSRISETERLIGEKKCKLKEVALYISKRAELLFSTLRMNRVEISLYDVVKSTGEVKDTFRFTYNGRRYDRLSLSEKIRAGMEVSELMKRLTGRNYPVFVDNMESVDDLANVRPTGQIIMAKCVPNAALAVHGKQAVQSQPMAA
ncbi:AAA family ATPase [Bengtsoniella intestinalis]|uniref:AAA family ATPase n=1 Tax=Bengtsoniella intestinalis TaxID=3073143 RepID=UPI00391F2324